MPDTLEIPFQTVDWNQIEKTLHPGQTGLATWQTLEWPGLRIRVVEYSAGYLADHWCSLGHIVYCLDGELASELKNGEIFTLTVGMSYVVSDDLSTHRSRTRNGVRLFIIDGDFLKSKK